MCGIIGIYKQNYSNNDYKFISKSLEFLLCETEIRGMDTSGIQIKNSFLRKRFLFKRNVRSRKLIKDFEYAPFIKESLKAKQGFISILGHCRMQTNGDSIKEENNQPTIKNGTTCVHNGIITNIERLWKEHSEFQRKYEIDTEIICDFFNNGSSYKQILKKLYKQIYGETTFGIMPSYADDFLFSTNTGSSYYLYNKKSGLFVFSSEKVILGRYKRKFFKDEKEMEILQLLPNQCLLIKEKTGELYVTSISKMNTGISFCENSYNNIINSKIIKKQRKVVNTIYSPKEKNILEYNVEKLRHIKRCTKCLLPVTFPFIKFDEKGVCNYCHNYEKIKYESKNKFNEILKKEENNKLLLTFSGGRDSCYGMHLLKKMNKDILSYTYDWGIVTDLARRNQSRMCGSLGVEHIIVSADINKKRKNIKKNVKAWLNRPSLGLIPLFMAGDKQYFYYANKVAKENGMSNLIILCDNPFEVTYFKFGFAGAKPNFIKKGQLFRISIFDNFKMVLYYGKEFLLNPRLINSSIFDTVKAYISYYGISHNYINLFKYFKWDENEIEDILINKYNWELAEDTETTWRIGDGTAPFYNYIYTTVAGFSENDTFRSNQIREGIISREEGLELVLRDNKPRYESIKWYLDIIGLDFASTMKKINNIKKMY